VIAKTKHSETLRSQERVPPCIAFEVVGFEVLPAVNLDDELNIVTNEIDDVWTYRGLTPEASTIQSVRTHGIPDDALGVGRISAQ
jgi:hypothetical protein